MKGEQRGPQPPEVGGAAAAPTETSRPKRVIPIPAGSGVPGMSAQGRAGEPTAVILAADILRWIIPKVGRFPKQVRHGLGARIEAAHLDVLEHIVAAQYSRGSSRTRHLERANERLQSGRHLLRMARELNLISERSAVYAASLQVDLGRQVGAWQRASGATASSSAS